MVIYIISGNPFIASVDYLYMKISLNLVNAHHLILHFYQHFFIVQVYGYTVHILMCASHEIGIAYYHGSVILYEERTRSLVECST